MLFGKVEHTGMGRFVRGDVILTRFPLTSGATQRTGPPGGFGTGERGRLRLPGQQQIPIAGVPSIPLGLDDFSEGGLDLLSESFVLTAKVSI